MYYCIKCGDPISPGEMVCDKCGYKFTFIEGTNIPVEAAGRVNAANTAGGVVNTATVYMQPVSRQGATAGTQAGTGMPAAAGTRAGASPQPGPGVPQGARPQAAAQGSQTAPRTQAAPQTPPRPQTAPRTQAAPQTTAPRPQASTQPPKPAKKKKSRKWMIPFFIILGLLTTGFIVFLVIGALLIGGVIMLFSDENLYVDNSTPSTSYQTDTGTVSYDNTAFTTDNEYVDSAIRDPFVTLKGDGTDTVTVMVYLNGSSLESDNGCATSDLKEMLSASLSDNVNVVIQTGGTRKWHNSNISSKKSQRYVIQNNTLVLVDDSLGQLDVTEENTLADFITFCATNYPADRNILILWDHGAGPVYGFGENEVGRDYYAALTLDEMQRAIARSGVKFEMIGFDACLMGTIETACALYDHADYLIASEDFEPGEGWQYQNWLSLLGYNSSTPMKDVAKVIIDDFIADSRSNGNEAILSLIDLRYMRLLFSAWGNFAYASEADLLACNYNMEMQRSDRAGARFEGGLWEYLFGGSTLDEYYNCVDLMALASTVDSDEAKALSSALSYALVYSAATSGDAEMTGLSVTLPYGDSDFYNDMADIFLKCGLDQNYVTFLKKFVSADASQSYDWSSSGWDGWDSYYDSDDSYGSDYDWSYYDWDDYTDEDYDWDSYDYDDYWYSPWGW